MIKRFLILAGVVSMAGCVPHFKDLDSYNTQFRDTNSVPESITNPPGKSDPYTFGGIAEGSGGQMARQSYATDTNSPDFRDGTETGKMSQIAKDRTHTPDGPSATGTTNPRDLPAGQVPPDAVVDGKSPAPGR